MQWKAARQGGDKRVGYLDPSLIRQTAHDWPLKLKADSSQLRECKTKKEREKKIRELHRDEKIKVAMYIANSIKFNLDEGRDEILAPYHFE